MEESEPRPVGETTVRVVNDSVIEIVSVGFITRDLFDHGLAELTAHCAAHPKLHALMWTTTDLEGYEAGNTAQAMKWVARHTQIRRAAVVTRSQVVASLTHIGRVMVPGLEARSFRVRAEALEWFATPLTGRPRTRSNRHKAA